MIKQVMKQTVKQTDLSRQPRVSPLQARLGWLRQLMARMDSEPETRLLRRIDALAITLMGLEGLEQRVAAGSESGLENEPAVEAVVAIVRLRCAEADAELMALTIDALGYYALPLFDPKMMHNEGPPGPLTLADIGQGAIAESFGYVGGFEDIFDEWALRSLIARAIDGE